MKLKIRYEDRLQSIELNEDDVKSLWISLSLEGADMSSKEKEHLLQDTWDVEFNRGDYNNWHKHNRHSSQPHYTETDADPEAGGTWCEPLMEDTVDNRIFFKDELEREREWDYEIWREAILKAMKPSQASLIIAIALDGMTVEEYAALIGDKPNNVSHRYRRAVKKFREIFPKEFFKNKL